MTINLHSNVFQSLTWDGLRMTEKVVCKRALYIFVTNHQDSDQDQNQVQDQDQEMVNDEDDYKDEC